LAGRVAIVTGVGRAEGIGFAIARRLLDDGYRVLAHSLDGAPFDESERLRRLDIDLGEPEAPGRVIEAALDAFGVVDALVVNHAHSSDQSLATASAEELDRAWAVNARAAVLLARAFAASTDACPPMDDKRREDWYGRIVFLTSGQHLGPMPGELPYVLTKGAVQQAVATLADELAERGITVNAVNPGPVDTGWATTELHEQLAARFPADRWGRPDDIAPVVAWLLSAESAWVTGQVIDAEGGFRR
jgi:3-oxoacyl-[acyl-carrier protein] reductase